MAWPGRERDYDANSRVTSGFHNGRTIFYAFGRYPSDLSGYSLNNNGEKSYPVIDFIMCHGDFINADRSYVHRNKNIKEFGSYGDMMIRDRKIYVAPTPFTLTEGTAGLMTLIVPEDYLSDGRFRKVGELVRTECSRKISGYSFDFAANILEAKSTENEHSGKKHRFAAYRLTEQSPKKVTMAER